MALFDNGMLESSTTLMVADIKSELVDVDQPQFRGLLKPPARVYNQQS